MRLGSKYIHVLEGNQQSTDVKQEGKQQLLPPLVPLSAPQATEAWGKGPLCCSWGVERVALQAEYVSLVLFFWVLGVVGFASPPPPSFFVPGPGLSNLTVY